MNRRERLMNTIQGKPVDRPAVCFYEINGLDQNPLDPSPFNIYADPSWKSLIELTQKKTDRIPRRRLTSLIKQNANCPLLVLTNSVSFMEGKSTVTKTSIKCKDRILTHTARRDPDVDTLWILEHFLKSSEDLQAYLELPLPLYNTTIDKEPVLSAENALGDSGIVLIDTSDPLRMAAEMFQMEEYLVTAMMEPELFRQLLERFASILNPLVDRVAKELPGRLWRIVGPEYASEPFLPPHLFKEFVTNYDTPIVKMIQDNGGYARIHSHGNLKSILQHIADTGCTGLDPVEPAPQGDVTLAEAKKRVGKQMVLWGNLEANDIEILPTLQFREKVNLAIDEGMAGEGRGFVLMPSACPYGRKLPALALKNYETIIEVMEERFGIL